ncbi:DUF3139 domain-containing protein [Clostridium bornimense]|uniref:DUF3139 domain-containing protein n=1 Tax=Clostridium bornimense TaxID=1216932 RepID=UPI001C11C5FA|nr:DUF3139 domain-containing protein [Clostridium bornimense]MBU5317542.1 DUF3139 domain-containing protein [Clostridium bornimense]
MKKWIIIIITLIAIVFGYTFIVRYISHNKIYSYIEKQGINKEDILIEDFRKNWTDGGYIDCIYVKGEDVNIFYEYYYKNHEVEFNAVKSDESHIKEGIWGGAGLTEEEEKNIKYPPLK